jgi:hypothetical protein
VSGPFTEDPDRPPPRPPKQLPYPWIQPPHSTCSDVTPIGYAPGSKWVCGPDCPKDDDQHDD